MEDPQTLGNLTEWLTNLLMEKVFLIFNGIFVCYSLCLLPMVISLFTAGKGFIISVHSDQVEEDSSKTTSLPSFLEVEQTWVSLPLHICLVLQPLTVLVALQWCCYNMSMSCTGDTLLDTVLQMLGAKRGGPGFRILLVSCWRKIADHAFLQRYSLR